MRTLTFQRRPGQNQESRHKAMERETHSTESHLVPPSPVAHRLASSLSDRMGCSPRQLSLPLSAAKRRGVRTGPLGRSAAVT
jgi:hypothetical protein